MASPRDEACTKELVLSVAANTQFSSIVVTLGEGGGDTPEPLTIINSAAMNIGVHVSLSILVSSV